MLLDALVVSSGADNDFEAERGSLVPCAISPGKLRQRRLAFGLLSTRMHDRHRLCIMP